VLYMDVWSLAELLECVKELGLELKPDEVVSRYIEFGGSVRLVLWSLTYTFKQLEDAFSADDDLLPLLNLQLSGLRSMASHLLMHIRVSVHLWGVPPRNLPPLLHSSVRQAPVLFKPQCVLLMKLGYPCKPQSHAPGPAELQCALKGGRPLLGTCSSPSFVRVCATLAGRICSGVWYATPTCVCGSRCWGEPGVSPALH
jgi:hypothetical protein